MDIATHVDIHFKKIQILVPYNSFVIASIVKTSGQPSNRESREKSL